MTKSRLGLAAGLLAVVSSACSTDAPVSPLTETAPQPLFSRAAQEEAVVEDEILIGLKDGATLDEVVRGHGVALSRLGFQGRFAVLKGAKGRERALAAILKNDPRVEFAEPNYLRQPDAVDPKLWAFYNPGGLTITFTDPADTRYGTVVTSKLSTRDADEDAVGTFAAGGAPVVVASLDTGVDLDHSEFTGRLILGKDWVNNDNTPEDDDGHGTHTSGTIAGSTVGVAGATGAAANVKVYVQKVCGPSGCPTSAIVNAIYAAADYPGMVAMNLSLGGKSESTAEKNAIRYAAVTKGVLVIASAGNSGNGKVGCPACDPNAVSVAALNWQDQLSYYSQYGSGLDISAPGGELYSNTSEEAGIYSAYLSGGYAFLQGTSMAAPQVTGVAAIVASKLGLKGNALRNRLLSTADDLGAAGTDTRFGAGRVNAYRAVTGGSTATQ